MLSKNFINITEFLFYLQLLVDRNPEGLQSRDNRGWQPIHEAAFNGNVDCLRYLFRVFYFPYYNAVLRIQIHWIRNIGSRFKGKNINTTFYSPNPNLNGYKKISLKNSVSLNGSSSLSLKISVKFSKF